jgi:hypothetical protein
MFIVLFMVFNQLKKLKMAPLVLDRTQLYWEKKIEKYHTQVSIR